MATKLVQGLPAHKGSLSEDGTKLAAVIKQLRQMTLLRLLPPDLLDGSAQNVLGSPA